MPFKFGGGNKCVDCDKTVYSQEQLVFEGRYYHKFCFKCNLCKKRINNISKAGSMDGHVTHRDCFSKQMRAAGGKYGGVAVKGGAKGKAAVMEEAAPKPEATGKKLTSTKVEPKKMEQQKPSWAKPSWAKPKTAVKREVKREENKYVNNRTFSSADAKGGQRIEASSTALVLIEYQNEFATEGGKLHEAVAPVMKSNSMLEKSLDCVKKARTAGVKIFHTPITFSEDMSDNPNKGLGILKGCCDGKLFVRGTWNSAIIDSMKPEEGDVQIEGKRGLDAFPGSNLEEMLVKHKIQTVAIAGFLTNCCVESTMRTAYEKGFNVITLTDMTAATTEAGQAHTTDGTFGMFSTPMEKVEFLKELGIEEEPKAEEPEPAVE